MCGVSVEGPESPPDPTRQPTNEDTEQIMASQTMNVAGAQGIEHIQAEPQQAAGDTYAARGVQQSPDNGDTINANIGTSTFLGTPRDL